jgi:hypothetical protein
MARARVALAPRYASARAVPFVLVSADGVPTQRRRRSDLAYSSAVGARITEPLRRHECRGIRRIRHFRGGM